MDGDKKVCQMQTSERFGFLFTDTGGTQNVKSNHTKSFGVKCHENCFKEVKSIN